VAPLLAFARRAAAASRRVASVCTGAFILAGAGLLDGRAAATHWRYAALLQRQYPLVRVDGDRIFVRDGAIWTSAGITAGIDLALALIGADQGEDIARRVARELVVHHRRLGGQSQFSSLNELAPPDGRFAALLAWTRDHLDRRLTVEVLAERSAMSPRHFARAFAAETGTTPAKAIERLRVEAARARIEQGAEPLDLIARQSGFGQAERLRKACVRAFGLAPQAMRRQARRS
jgi:transcriptional regulator GlxA family with amidase domain